MVRSKQKKPSVFLPLFFLLLFLLAASYFIWNTYYTPQGVTKETSIITGNDPVQVRLGESENFIGTSVDSLLEGESIRSKNGGAKLEFFDGSTLVLDSGTTVTIVSAREREKDSAEIIHVRLDDGRIWLHAKSKINPKSEVIIETTVFDFKTKGGIFSVGKGEIIALSGSGMIEIGDTYSEDIEIGQAIAFTSENISAIESGSDGPQKTTIPSDFQESEWFSFYSSPESVSNTEKEDEIPLEELEEEGAPEEQPQEKENISLLTPGKNDEVVEIEESSVPISGTVPKGTQKVIINDYTLSRFTPGDTTFTYNAATQWNTLKEGRNEYTIVALGTDDERYEAEITIIYEPNGGVDDEETEKTEEDTEEEREEKEDTEEDTGTKEEKTLEEKTEADDVDAGELTITTPEQNAEVLEDVILVSGKAPKNAVDIRVNDYVLSAFSAGDETWFYRISSAIGNRTAGEYTITAEALDANGKVLQKATRNFIIKPLSGTNEKYMPEMRGGTLPPIEQDDTGGPTI